MALLKKKYIVILFFFLYSFSGIKNSFPEIADNRHLIMGAQKDFMLATEGKMMVFDTLATLDDSGNLVPSLATSWETSSNGKKWTIRLREGVTYHDGTVFNAKTSVFSLKKAMSEAVWARYIDDIKIVDDNTIEIDFNTFYQSFLLDLASGWLSENFVSPNAVEPKWQVDGKIVKFVGTGPFQLEDYKKDRYAVLIKNKKYWGEKPDIEKVTWKVTPDPYAQILSLKAGELDIIGAPEHHSSVPFMMLSELSSNKDFQVFTASYGRYQIIEFNCHKPPFDDLMVRKAFNCAIDREKMVRSLFGNITDPVYLITDPKFIWGPSNIKNGYGYDPVKAKALLYSAGWKDADNDGFLEKNGRIFEVELLVPTGEANADMVALVVQSQLRDLGVRVNIKNLIDAWDLRMTGEYELFLGTSGCLPSIPGGIGIGGKYHSKGDWPYAFHSPGLDTLIEKAFTTTDPEKTRYTCDDIWKILHEENPCIPLYDIVKAVVINKRVQGFQQGATMFDMALNNIEISR